jgi:hypothetical protein
MKRRSIAVIVLLLLVMVSVINNPEQYRVDVPPAHTEQVSSEALEALRLLPVKGRAPKTGYQRSQFGDGWAKTILGCDTRNEILRRDLVNTTINTSCQVVSGTLIDPYSATTIEFKRGASSSQAVQVDHIVPLSDAWQKGAQQLSYEERVQLANDPLELIAVSGSHNQQKSDGDAATWLPPNKAFRCQYISRQIAVKKKYSLWVTQPEKDAMIRVLNLCPGQRLPIGS